MSSHASKDSLLGFRAIFRYSVVRVAWWPCVTKRIFARKQSGVADQSKANINHRRQKIWGVGGTTLVAETS